MARAKISKRTIRRGLSLQQDPFEEQPEMEYEEEEEEEDDLSDLLEEEPEPEMEMEPEIDDESGLVLMKELDNLYKVQDDRDTMILSLAKSVRTIAKRVLQLEGVGEEGAPKAAVKKEAPEGDFTVGGEKDMGEEIQGGGEGQTPGLTAGNPQGIAQKAVIAKALADSGVAPDVIQKATGLIFKDDKWTNFGDKDSDVPANAPVTPDTKDWDEDFGIVPGSGNAPDNVKGIGKVAKALADRGIDQSAIDKMLESGGIIRKAVAPTIGAGAQGEAVTIENVEERGRSMSFGDLNRMRQECGDLPAGL